MIRKTVDSPTEKTWVSERGELTIRRPTPLVVLFVERGHLDADFAPIIVEEYERASSGDSRPWVFVDCQELITYDLEVRQGASRWIQRNRHSISVQHMLVRSPFVRMGLRVVSLLLGGVIVGHHERRTFEQALRQAVAQTSRSNSRTVA